MQEIIAQPDTSKYFDSCFRERDSLGVVIYSQSQRVCMARSEHPAKDVVVTPLPATLETLLEIENTAGRLQSINVTSDDNEGCVISIEIDGENMVEERLDGSVTLDLPFSNHLKIEGHGQISPVTGNVWITFETGETPTIDIQGSDISIEYPIGGRHVTRYVRETRKTREELTRTRKQMKNLPDVLTKAITEAVEETVEGRYDEIEEIVTSSDDAAKKQNELVREISVGMERGLPTILFEITQDSE